LYAGTFALWSLAQALTGLARSVAMLIGCRVLLGIGEAIYLVGGTRVVSLFFPMSQRGLPCGLFDAGTRTGLVPEGLAIGWLLQTLGWRATFIVVGLAALVWLLPWFLATPPQMRETSGPRAQPAVPDWTQIGVLLRNRDLLGVLLGFFCFDYFWYLLLTWLPSYLINVRRLTILRAGIYASLPFLVFGVCQPLGGWIADRLIRQGYDPGRTRKGMISVAFLTGLLIIPAAYAPTAGIALLFFIGSCLVGLSTANQIVLLQACTPPDRLGLAVGVYNFVGNIAGVLAPIVTGLVIRASGSYTPAFVLAAVAMALSQFGYWFIVGEKRRSRERASARAAATPGTG
jgi:MFS family permease